MILIAITNQVTMYKKPVLTEKYTHHCYPWGLISDSFAFEHTKYKYNSIYKLKCFNGICTWYDVNGGRKLHCNGTSILCPIIIFVNALIAGIIDNTFTLLYFQDFFSRNSTQSTTRLCTALQITEKATQSMEQTSKSKAKIIQSKNEYMRLWMRFLLV